MSTPLAIPGDACRPAALPWPSARTTSIPPTCHYAGAQGEQALAAYLEASSLQSSVSSEIYRLAMELAVEVKVLADAEYDRRHPGTGGITTGPSQARKVFMPVRSLVEPANTTLERELLHACIELDASPCKVLYQTTVDTSRNSIARQDAVEQLFMGIGGTPAQGRAWLQGLEGIPQHVLDGTGDRMLGSAIDRLVCRQKSGRPLDVPETLAIMRAAAKGEAAMHLLGKVVPEQGEPTTWTTYSVYTALRSMYGTEALAHIRIGDIDHVREQLSTFLRGKIQAFNDARDAYAGNRPRGPVAVPCPSTDRAMHHSAL